MAKVLVQGKEHRVSDSRITVACVDGGHYPAGNYQHHALVVCGGEVVSMNGKYRLKCECPCHALKDIDISGFSLVMLQISVYMTETWLLRLRYWRKNVEDDLHYHGGESCATASCDRAWD